MAAGPKHDGATLQCVEFANTFWKADVNYKPVEADKNHCFLMLFSINEITLCQMKLRELQTDICLFCDFYLDAWLLFQYWYCRKW